MTSSFSRGLSCRVLALFLLAPAKTLTAQTTGAIPTQIPQQNAILMGVAW